MTDRRARPTVETPSIDGDLHWQLRSFAQRASTALAAYAEQRKDREPFTVRSRDLDCVTKDANSLGRACMDDVEPHARRGARFFWHTAGLEYVSLWVTYKCGVFSVEWEAS